eukprot:s223_g23.t1
MKKELEAFYERLNRLQETFEVSPWYKPIIVSVEGANMKFIEDVAAMFRPYTPVRVASSPPASGSVVRGIFQQLGGAAAKAFDVVSNYMAVQECKDVCMAEHQPLVFIMENFCSSARRGLSEDVAFAWPPGLLKPKLQIVLRDDDDDATSPAAEWEKLILTKGSSEQHMLQLVKGGINKKIFPSTEDLQSLGADPLRYLVEVSRKEGLLGDRAGDKKWQLGRRGKHIPWSFQLATPNRSPGGPPALRNLGIHSVTETGFIFFTLGSAGGASGQAGEEVVASMVLLLGSYPFQQQWRGEGIVRKMRGSTLPPFSLACAMQRCKELAHELAGSTKKRRFLEDQEAVLGTRPDDTREGPSTAYIFIPRRMEVLIAHPPAPGGTRRCEWQRLAESRLWEGPRVVLPFSPYCLEVSWEPRVRKATVVIMGSHTAGKSSVRKRLAERMQWESDEELGTSMRGEKEEQGKYQKAWDDVLHQAEVARDQERMSTSTSRVVETWHLGNFVWALTRRPEQHGDLLKRAEDAIQQEQEATIVLLVLLKINPATMVRRRATFQTSALAFQDEEADASKLAKATGEKLDQMLGEHDFCFRHGKLPVLKLDNNQDGEEALNDTVDAIVDFITLFV